MSLDTPNEIDSVTVLAQRAYDHKPEPIDPHKLQTMVIPVGLELKTVDLEKHLPQPRRPKGAVKLHDAGSLVKYVHKHRMGSATALYADIDNSTITAVINGHAADTGDDEINPSGWGDHRASVILRLTPEWKLWSGKDRTWLNQVPFAEHVEECQADIIEPLAADMLELAQTLQAKNSVNFRSQNLLANGQRQFTYEETLSAQAGEKGKLTIPGLFRLGLRVYEGSVEGYSIVARLQFRLDHGDLKFRYLLDRADQVLRSAFDDVVMIVEKPVDEDGTGIKAYRGAAPAPLQ